MSCGGEAKPWHKVVRLKEELCSNAFSLAEFAADLHEVSMGEDRGTGSRGTSNAPGRSVSPTRLRIARHGLARHVAGCLVLPARHGRLLELVVEPGVEATGRARGAEHRCRLGETQGRECGRIGHLKIGFDIRSPVPPDPLTGVRRPRNRRLEACAAPEQHALRAAGEAARLP